MSSLFNSRMLRVVMVLMVASLTLSVTGCSWFKKKPLQNGTGAPGTALTTPNLGNEPGTGTLPEAPRPTDLTEFDAATTGIKDVHFDYDKAAIKASENAILDKNLEYFKAHPEVKIMIVGHADERGTVEYNFGLGQRRAASIQEYLLKNGIATDRLATLSKGKEEPVDPANNEAAYAKNRRVHFLKMN